ncbi:hypothetical protein [Ensifer adhaerens]|uniref:hypothetical protein n=1 Tax=Ensifer adhaerens TaxID=106592 RepID=UPI00098EF4A9|nr:hypothetical protein [Ensifer adhaerens]
MTMTFLRIPETECAFEPADIARQSELAGTQSCLYSSNMRTLGTLIISAVLAFFGSLLVAGLFLPVYGIFQGGSYNCLKDGIGECTSMIPLSALIYGPLFSIVGVLVGTPVLMTIFAMRE